MKEILSHLLSSIAGMLVTSIVLMSKSWLPAVLQNAEFAMLGGLTESQLRRSVCTLSAVVILLILSLLFLSLFCWKLYKQTGIYPIKRKFKTTVFAKKQGWVWNTDGVFEAKDGVKYCPECADFKKWKSPLKNHPGEKYFCAGCGTFFKRSPTDEEFFGKR